MISVETWVRELLELRMMPEDLLLVHTSFSKVRSIMELLDKYY